MANANTDLTEEDAADLQFPKDCGPPAFYSSDSDSVCSNCSCDLVAPYIYCALCKVNICSLCFSKGAEFGGHKNDHDYHIIRDDFPVWGNTDWTAREEVVLLESLQKYGNWNLVAKEFPNRSVREIRAHYDWFYLDRKGSKDLPEASKRDWFCEPVVPYRQRISDTDEPPRYSPNTVGYKSLAGYNPARSDFECEFDSSAEDLLSNLKPVDKDDPHFDLITNLQCAIIQSYNRRLRERQRWKKIIREHGLIILRKVYAWLHRYDVTITRPVYEKLIRFMQFCTPVQFEMLMEGLHHSGELKIQILRLCELRQRGITSLADARLYVKLKEIHDKCENELKTLHASAQFNWKLTNRSFPVETPKKKSGFTPIEIIGMPGYEKLTPSERELCRTVRLVPITYLELKDILITENKKMGSIKLKTARKILKIDVNKTRRLYDFLVQEGYIVKPVS
ncbi:transcriptional adapter 2-alpha isoform X1 [Tribolium castaneum]|uniref:transcriptional adapter 2-alpha isoform X1 n=1 Tax=Tribolium castaneum TaxID=7070 RepID=UPI0030FE3B9B